MNTFYHREAFHSMGTMLNVPKPSVRTPASMAPSSVPHSGPSAPGIESGVRSRQITVPRLDPVEYAPSRRKPNLILDTKREDFIISNDCEIKVKNHNEMTMILSCVKEHYCDSKPSLKMFLKDLGDKPTENSLFFHLRMLHEDPSSLTTVRHLLDELQEHYIEKFKIEKIIVAADGKLFDHLLTLFISHGDKYRHFLPYLGKNESHSNH